MRPLVTVPLATVGSVSVPPPPSALLPHARKFWLKLFALNLEYRPVTFSSNWSDGRNWTPTFPPYRSRSCSNRAEPISEGTDTVAPFTG